MRNAIAKPPPPNVDVQQGLLVSEYIQAPSNSIKAYEFRRSLPPPSAHERAYLLGRGEANRVCDNNQHFRARKGRQPSEWTTFTSEVKSKQWLAYATAQLDECSICAAEEELPPPSLTAIAKSRKLLQQFSASITSQPDIYPMRESSLAIDFRTPDGRSGVLFVIEQDGSGALFYPTRDSDGWSSVEDAADLFEKRGADELKRAGIR